MTAVLLAVGTLQRTLSRLDALEEAIDYMDALERLRGRLERVAGIAVARFFRGQAGRVVERLTAETADLLPAEEGALLAAALEPSYRAALTGTHAAVQAAIGVSFDLPNPAVAAYLREVGANIPTITQTTRDAIREALAAGTEAGEGVDNLAKRLRGLPAFGRKRARLVAVTELANATNNATLASYEASEVVVGVLVMDGDYDPECAAANGRRLTLEQARTFPRIAHPRCRRAFAPITNRAELERAA